VLEWLTESGGRVVFLVEVVILVAGIWLYDYVRNRGEK
jgi:hypothetical protein